MTGKKATCPCGIAYGNARHKYQAPPAHDRLGTVLLSIVTSFVYKPNAPRPDIS